MRKPREVALNADGDELSIKWRNSWHADSCECFDCQDFIDFLVGLA